MKFKVTPILLATLLVTTGAAAGAEAPPAGQAKPVLRVVFFSPSDVDPPAGVRERLSEYVDYSQMFFAKWM